ncbi:MAG TPA: glycosyltransferase [Terriglobales bacterium]|nr:glycosyltransferase [Terriglobales bacterium]
MSIIATLAVSLCVLVVAYVYAGYPLALAAGLLGGRKRIRQSAVLPRVSVIVPAHNEQDVIGGKIENIRAFAYPPGQIEILVGSDGSTDATAEIVGRYEGVHLYESGSQSGKSAVQNELVKRSSGEILLFTDADCFAAPHALSYLVENFADPRVGLVTARPSYFNNDENEVTHNEGSYLRYESWLQRQESERGLLAMASGSFFAVRRSLWQPLQGNVGDDFVLPLQVALQGYRNVLDPRATVRTRLTQNELGSVLAMRRRIVSKDLLGLIRNRAVLNPLRTGAVAIALWSHKLLRWLVPYFLLIAFLANLFLLHGRFFFATLALQIAFYALAVVGVAASRRVKSLWSIPASFCVMNFAALLATLQCISGRTSGRWKPARVSR